MNECINCGSNDTKTYWEDDGHFRKKCNDCNYIGGPYITEQSI